MGYNSFTKVINPLNAFTLTKFLTTKLHGHHRPYILHNTYRKGFRIPKNFTEHLGAPGLTRTQTCSMPGSGGGCGRPVESELARQKPWLFYLRFLMILGFFSSSFGRKIHHPWLQIAPPISQGSFCLPFPVTTSSPSQSRSFLFLWLPQKNLQLLTTVLGGQTQQYVIMFTIYCG